MRSKVICVIMGGGRGTRLHPLTQERCKPAVPLGGKYRLVDIPISNCLNSGFNQIYVLTQFNTASLHRHIQESYKFDPFGGGFVDILSAEQTERGEQWYQGTADAVRQNLHHYGAHENDIIVILSGDQLYRMDLSEVVSQHRNTAADVTIAARAMIKSRVEGLGLMRVEDDLSIAEFAEKPKDPKVIDSLTISDALKKRLQDPSEGDYCLANMGIYVFNVPALLEALDNSMDDFGKEIIPGLLGKMKLNSYIFQGYWEDIGTVRSFFEANLSLTDTVPPFNFFEQDRPIYTRARYLPAAKVNKCTVNQAIIAGGCILNGVTLNKVIAGVRSMVDWETQMDNVVMMGSDWFERPDERVSNKQKDVPHIGVGQGCRIRNAIIDKNARIGRNVRLDPEGKEDGKYADGRIFIRDGVLIVSKNALIPDGFSL